MSFIDYNVRYLTLVLYNSLASHLYAASAASSGSSAQPLTLAGRGHDAFHIDEQTLNGQIVNVVKREGEEYCVFGQRQMHK